MDKKADERDNNQHNRRYVVDHDAKVELQLADAGNGFEVDPCECVVQQFVMKKNQLCEKNTERRQQRKAEDRSGNDISLPGKSFPEENKQQKTEQRQ